MFKLKSVERQMLSEGGDIEGGITGAVAANAAKVAAKNVIIAMALIPMVVGAVISKRCRRRDLLNRNQHFEFSIQGCH